MAQHGLDGTQVRSPLQQMSSKRMPERMRADRLTDARGLAKFLDKVKDHDSTDVRPPTETEKDEILFPPFNLDLVTLCEIQFQFLDGPGRNGNQPLLATLPFHLDEPLL